MKSDKVEIEAGKIEAAAASEGAGDSLGGGSPTQLLLPPLWAEKRSSEKDVAGLPHHRRKNVLVQVMLDGVPEALMSVQ